MKDILESIHPKYKEYASIIGLIIADTCIATILLYTAHFVFAWPVILICVVALCSIITRTGIYSYYKSS